MKKFLLITAALILALFIGLQTPYVVRSSEVFCKTSSPLPRHCMLIKKTSTDDVSLQPFYSSAAPAKFFAFDAYVEGARLSSKFKLARYISEGDVDAEAKYRKNYEKFKENCISEPSDYNLILVTGKKNSECTLYRKRIPFSYYSPVDKTAKLRCNYRISNDPTSGLQPYCTYSGFHSGWGWTIFIRSTQLPWWQEIVSAAKQHLDDNFEHIHHPIIVIPLI